MSQKWIYKPEPDEDIVDGLISSIGFGTLESKLLVLRGIDNYQSAREFFKPNGNDFHSPFLMTAGPFLKGHISFGAGAPSAEGV